jgi:hypothetical protein
VQRTPSMKDLRSSLLGLLGGAVGLGIMEAIRRSTKPLVEKRAAPEDIFVSTRSMSPLGPHHRPSEPATEAVGRILYEKIGGHEPSGKTRRKLSLAVHLGYGLLVAGMYGTIRGGKASHMLLEGALFGAGLWLFGDELAVPLLGLADKPTAYPMVRHAQALAQHLGFGLATAVASNKLAKD